MRRPLLALNLVIAVGMGASSFGDALATNARASIVKSDLSNPASRSSAAVSGSAIVQYAMKFLGYPYTATGNSPSTGFSCIGFVSYVYRSLGIDLPGDLGDAMAFAPSVSFSNLQPGDILFFQNTVWVGLSHAAIYIGGGKFIHAEWYNRGVVISSFTNDPVDGNYWTEHYLGANRPWTGAAVSAPVTAPVSGATPTPTAQPVQPPPVPRPSVTPVPTAVVRHRPSGPIAVVRVPSLNVRSGPSIRAAIQTSIPRGTRVVVLGSRQGWYRVALPRGRTGWVIGPGIGKGPAQRPARRFGGRNVRTIRRPAIASRRSTATRYRARAGGSRARRSITPRVNGLRVRSAPSLGASVLGSVGRGQRVAVVTMTSAWVKVRLPSGRTGWISRQFAQAPSRRSPSRHLLRAGAPTHRIVKATSHAVARAAVNVRRGPSLTAAIASIVPAGGTYRILSWSHGWARVRLGDGGAGWIDGAVLPGAHAATGPAAAKSTSGTTRLRAAAARSVVTAGVRIRAKPGLTGATIGLVAAGTRVQVLGTDVGWTKVRLPSRQTGYILGIYVRT